MTTNYLHSLSCKQLISILRHVQYGHEHLSHQLSKNEYRDLLAIGSLSYNQVSRIASDRQEKIGNVAIVVNTILTSCFGAWLGFNAFTHHSIITPIGLIIILLAVVFGYSIGYLSYYLTHRQAKLISQHQQLANVERVIIEIIINKRQAKIERMKEHLFQLLQEFSIVHHDRSDQSEKRLFDLLNSLRNTAKINMNKVVKRAIKNIERNIQKLQTSEIIKNTDEPLTHSTDFFLNNALTNASYIKTLTKSTIVKKYHIPKVNNWLKKNFAGVLVGLVPTFLGSFASMFVFLNGIPALLHGLGFAIVFDPTQILYLKKMGLMTALLLSLYFAYSHIHSNYKAFKRSKQLELSEKKVADLSNQMLLLMSQINKWYKIYYQLQLIRDIQSILAQNEPSHTPLAIISDSVLQ